MGKGEEKRRKRVEGNKRWERKGEMSPAHLKDGQLGKRSKDCFQVACVYLEGNLDRVFTSVMVKLKLRQFKHSKYLDFLVSFKVFRRCCNLGQNKKEELAPLPPQSNDKGAKEQKRAIFTYIHTYIHTYFYLVSCT